MRAPDAAEQPAPGVQGRKSLDLWQEGDPERPSRAASEMVSASLACGMTTLTSQRTRHCR